jgi:phosphinothricin acetyltransferase
MHGRHAAAILDILNEAIENSTALYDYRPRTLASMDAWFEAKAAGHYPVIGMEDRGTLVGFATYGVFRNWPAYKYSVEHSVYVHHEHRGRGIGLTLMKKLINAAVVQQYHLMVAGIDVSNAPSIALHRKLGFEHAGTLAQVGFKFGRWLDLAFYSLILPTPDKPSDG